MLTDYIQQNNVRAQLEVADWLDAVRTAGQMLVDSGLVEESYIAAMIEMVREHGAYIVISPGLAIPHARPEDGALKVGFSLLTLKKPVEFGHPKNDPVDLVLAFCGVDSTSHVQMMSELAGFLGNKENVRKLRAAETGEEILNLIENVEKGGESR